MVWNDIQWYSYTHCHSCWCKLFEWIRIEWIRTGGIRVEDYVLVGYVLAGYVCDSCWCTPFDMDTHWMDTHSMDTYWWDTCWTDTYWWDTYWWDTYCKTCWCKPFEWIRIAWITYYGGIRVERIRIGGIRIGGIRFEWICVGYVWCDGYVWDMSGVRYANNLLKNPATKRLSEKMLKPISTSDWIFRFRRRHVKMELWLPTYQRWEPFAVWCTVFKRLPPVITSTEDKNIEILCSDWLMVALWKIVEIGRYEGVLCVSSDRRHSRPEDQAPDLLQMTEKRCAMAMAYLLWHLIIASVRRIRSLHAVEHVCTFHWLPLCVSSDRKCSRHVDQVVDHDG